jgi:hypothetical protein
LRAGHCQHAEGHALGFQTRTMANRSGTDLASLSSLVTTRVSPSRT